jgi:hypothetical protein
MAIDQTEKRRKVARDATGFAPQLMESLYALEALRARRDSGGPGGTPLAFVDSDFANQTGLTHVDKATIDAFFAAIPVILNAFANQNFNDIMEAMRP